MALSGRPQVARAKIFCGLDTRPKYWWKSVTKPVLAKFVLGVGAILVKGYMHRIGQNLAMP